MKVSKDTLISGLSGAGIGFLFAFGIFSFQTTESNNYAANMNSESLRNSTEEHRKDTNYRQKKKQVRYLNQSSEKSKKWETKSYFRDFDKTEHEENAFNRDYQAEEDKWGDEKIPSLRRAKLQKNGIMIHRKKDHFSDNIEETESDQLHGTYEDAVKESFEEEKEEWEEKHEQMKKRHEILLEKIKKRKEAMKKCRKETETREDFKECIQDTLEKEEVSYAEIKENAQKKSFLQERGALHEVKKINIREMIKKCLKKDPNNLRQCIQDTLREIPRRRKSKFDHEDERGSILGPIQQPEINIERDDSIPTI